MSVAELVPRTVMGEGVAPVISLTDRLPEQPLPQLNPQLESLMNSQRYRLWVLGVVALSGKEAAILRSAQLLEV